METFWTVSTVSYPEEEPMLAEMTTAALDLLFESSVDHTLYRYPKRKKK